MLDHYRQALAREMPQRSAEQESVNAVTHGLGFVLSLVGAWLVMAAVPYVGWARAGACIVYVATLALLYAASTLSHAVRDPIQKHWFRALDQGAVYLLIAGTYTPFLWVFLDSYMRWGCLVAVWAAALTGFYFKVFARHQVHAISTRSYILIGWVPAIPLHQFVPWNCLTWIALGGAIYSVGLVFLKLDHRARHFHAVWHICTILASICHFYAIYVYVLNA